MKLQPRPQKKRSLRPTPVNQKWKQEQDEGDEKEEGEEKEVYMSSPRKRLQQVKRQAKAMDEENARIDAHHITQDITKNFVHDVITDSLGFLCADSKK